MLTLFRNIQWVRDWIENRTDKRLMAELHAKYDPLIDAAKKAKNNQKISELEQEWSFQAELIAHPSWALAAERLTARARSLGIRVPPIREDSDDWERSNITGDWMLAPEAERLLRNEVIQAARAKNDEWRKWLTLFFAVIGTFLAAWSVFSKQKQPDPCPQNYYRNESGACLFAAPTKLHTTQELSPTPDVIQPSTESMR
jgi:hypothetical protein